MAYEKVSAENLGRITLMQSMATLLPDQTSVMKLICQGLKELPGIDSISYQLKTTSPDDKIDVAENQIELPIVNREQKFGFFLLSVSNYDLLSGYLPFLENFMNMLGVIFAEKHQRELNKKLTDELEQRVKERTQQLEERTENLRITLDSIGDAIIATDFNGRVVNINPVAQRLTGWSKEMALNKPLEEVFHIINSETGEMAKNPVKQVLAKGEVVELANHTTLIARDGREYHIADSAAPIRRADGNITGVVLVFRDVTDQKKTEQIIARSQMLESIGTLAGGIAHDFNNLLGGIFGFIDLARIAKSPEESSECLGKALVAMDRARNLTGQLLTFARGGDPVMKTESLIPFIEETTRFALSGSMVSCEFSLAEGLWNCEFDKNQLAQVLDNLVINAKNAMPSGGKIEVSAVNKVIAASENPDLEPGNYVKISIKDFGVGISRDVLKRIFDPFFTTRDEGHGLGLAVCYSVIKRHRGCIEVDSVIGQGSTFHFYIPARPGTELVKGFEKKHLYKGSGTIILMDDEELVCGAMQQMLELIGYHVLTVSDGKKAIELLMQRKMSGKRVDAMILDLTVPGGMGGKEAITEIRSFDQRLPVFVASGYASDPVMAKPDKFGFNGSIAKPFVLSELSELLFEHLAAN